MNTLKAFICVAVFIAGLGWIGTYERADQIIYTMDEETYEEIVTRLTIDGEKPSDCEIADYYIHHYCD